ERVGGVSTENSASCICQNFPWRWAAIAARAAVAAFGWMSRGEFLKTSCTWRGRSYTVWASTELAARMAGLSDAAHSTLTSGAVGIPLPVESARPNDLTWPSPNRARPAGAAWVRVRALRTSLTRKRVAGTQAAHGRLSCTHGAMLTG